MKTKITLLLMSLFLFLSYAYAGWDEFTMAPEERIDGEVFVVKTKSVNSAVTFQVNYIRSGNASYNSLYVKFNNQIIPIEPNQRITLSVDQNRELKVLLVKQKVDNIKVKMISITDSNLESVNIKSEPKDLEELTLYNCGLNEINVMSFTNLKYLNCSLNNLYVFNVWYNPNLTTLYCYDNHLQTVNVTNNKNLKILNCTNNEIEELDLSVNTQLEDVRCANNKINKLILKTQKLHTLYADNQKVEINITGNPTTFKNPITYDLNGSKSITIGWFGNSVGPNADVTLNSYMTFYDFRADKSATNGKEFHGRIKLNGYTPKPPTVPVNKVTLDNTQLSYTIGVGISLLGQLTATVAPDNATDKSLTWESSNSNVATVTSSAEDNKANIIYKGVGTCTITATSLNGKKATCEVTVTKQEYTIKIGPTKELNLRVGQSATLNASVTPSLLFGFGHTVKWSSYRGDNDIVTLTEAPQGITNPTQSIKVNAIEAGTTFVTATSANGIVDYCVVNVTKFGVGNSNIITTAPTAYPNPTYDIITIAGLAPGEEFHLYSTTGTLITTYMAQAESMTINLSGLKQGLYFVKTKSATLKIVKK